MLRPTRLNSLLAQCVWILAGALVPDAAIGALIPSGDEIAINSYTTGAQRNPVLVAAGDGGFIVVWTDDRPSEGGVSVRGRLVSGDGLPLGEEFAVSAGTVSTNGLPDIAATSDGSFVVVWRNVPSGSTVPRIRGRKLDAGGVPSGQAFAVNTARAIGGNYYLDRPAVAQAGDGGFVVVWASGVDDGVATPEIYALSRRFDSNGAPLGADQFISGMPGPFVSKRATIRSDIAALADGNLAVAWWQGEPDPYSFRGLVRFQRLAPDATVLGDSELVARGGRRGPRVIRDSSPGQSQVYWRAVVGERFDASAFEDLRQRNYSDTGEATSGEIVLASDLTQTTAPAAQVREMAVTRIDDERVVVVWTKASTQPVSQVLQVLQVLNATRGTVGDESAGIFARVFDNEGRPLGRPRKVTSDESLDAGAPEVISLGTDKVAIAWATNSEGPSSDVVARVFDLASPVCGDANDDGVVSAVDALFALGAAIGTQACHPCICDADGSGTHSASDALGVLRTAVGLPATMLCPQCAEDAALAYTLSEADGCAGVHLEIPATALPDDTRALACEVDADLLALGCDVTLVRADDGLVLDARDCFLSDSRLFSCAGSGDLAEIARTADVACGCSCALECPAPQLCVDVEGVATCSAEPAALTATQRTVERSVATVAGDTESVVPASSVTTVETVQVVTSSTSTTHCGTCCQLEESGSVEIEDELVLTELLVRVQTTADPAFFETCFFCDPEFGSIVALDDGIAFCLSSPRGVETPTTILCDGFRTFTGPGEVLRARGENFEPIDPLPAVIVGGGE